MRSARHHPHATARREVRDRVETDPSCAILPPWQPSASRADPVTLAKLIGDVAIGKWVDAVDDGKDAAAAKLRCKGGAPQSRRHTPERSTEITQKTAQRRASAFPDKSDNCPCQERVMVTDLRAVLGCAAIGAGFCNHSSTNRNVTTLYRRSLLSRCVLACRGVDVAYRTETQARPAAWINHTRGLYPLVPPHSAVLLLALGPGCGRLSLPGL